MLDIIQKTNGDILGVLLFILLIVHFLSLDIKTTYTNSLLLMCIVALVVDSTVVYKYVQNKN